MPPLERPDGVELHWEEQGEGPLVVLAPYWSGHPGVYEALLSNLGVKGVEVSNTIVKQYEKLLVGGIWSIITLQYFHEEGQKSSPFLLSDLKPIQRGS